MNTAQLTDAPPPAVLTITVTIWAEREVISPSSNGNHEQVEPTIIMKYYQLVLIITETEI